MTMTVEQDVRDVYQWLTCMSTQWIGVLKSGHADDELCVLCLLCDCVVGMCYSAVAHGRKNGHANRSKQLTGIEERIKSPICLHTGARFTPVGRCKCQSSSSNAMQPSKSIQENTHIPVTQASKHCWCNSRFTCPNTCVCKVGVVVSCVTNRTLFFYRLFTAKCNKLLCLCCAQQTFSRWKSFNRQAAIVDNSVKFNRPLVLTVTVTWALAPASPPAPAARTSTH